MNTFGGRVANARGRVKLRQTELAERVGVTPGAINKIESGETKGAKPSTLAALARTLGVSMEWLATGKEGYVLEPHGDYAVEQVNRLLAAWEGLPLTLRVPLLALIESMAGVEDPTVGSD
ncbi:helix-turn-helix domain-containing protein [Candidatus Thiosymbion oneisti]|uniref:helix-turn-helix domain-containing protein n=1 Tax=Candidatus Thiosymbion oneisti TaxID=589554 RepID=UPI00105F28B8|nr:helix-turn-helix transcriptional regulator [Candidatus Thiosymbion oneisti]